MTTATMTTKGQLTVPKKVRVRLNLKPGDKVEFREAADGTMTLIPRSLHPEDVVGGLSKYARGKKLTVEDMDRLLGEDFKRRGKK